MSIKAIMFEKKEIPTVLFFSGGVPVNHSDVYLSLKQLLGHSTSAGFLGNKTGRPEDFIIYGKSVSMGISANEGKNVVVTNLFHHGKIFYGEIKSGFFSFPLIFISSQVPDLSSSEDLTNFREITRAEYDELIDKVIYSVGSYI